MIVEKQENRSFPIGSMYGIYANIGGILMVNVTIYSIHGSYGFGCLISSLTSPACHLRPCHSEERLPSPVRHRL